MAFEGPWWLSGDLQWDVCLHAQRSSGSRLGWAGSCLPCLEELGRRNSEAFPTKPSVSKPCEDPCHQRRPTGLLESPAGRTSCQNLCGPLNRRKSGLEQEGSGVHRAKNFVL